MSHEGGLFTSAAGWGPEAGAGAVFRYDDAGADRVETPLDAGFIVGCAVASDGLYAVALDCADGFGQSGPAEVGRYDGEWTTLGTVPAGGRCLDFG